MYATQIRKSGRLLLPTLSTQMRKANKKTKPLRTAHMSPQTSKQLYDQYRVDQIKRRKRVVAEQKRSLTRIIVLSTLLIMAVLLTPTMISFVDRYQQELVVDASMLATSENLIEVKEEVLWNDFVQNIDHTLPLITYSDEIIDTDHEISFEELEELIEEPIPVGQPTVEFLSLETEERSISLLNSNQIPSAQQLATHQVTTLGYLNPLDSQYLGNDIIPLPNGQELVRYNTPDVYYPGINFSHFQPFMSYTSVTTTSSSAYRILNSERSYTDELGFRRYALSDYEFSINMRDDYFVALGNYYKARGSVGDRFLIITTTGMFTVIVGDEKSDEHTDSMRMFSRHGNNKQYAGVIEWILDSSSGLIPDNILLSGTVNRSPVEAHQGQILYIYKIE